jgi:hypothetical protein
VELHFQHSVQLGTSANYIMYVNTLTDVDMTSLSLTGDYFSSTFRVTVVIVMD